MSDSSRSLFPVVMSCKARMSLIPNAAAEFSLHSGLERNVDDEQTSDGIMRYKLVPTHTYIGILVTHHQVSHASIAQLAF